MLHIKCDVGVAMLSLGMAANTIAQKQSPFESMLYTLAAAGIWGFERAKMYGPKLLEARKKESEISRCGAALALHRFYSQVTNH